MQYIFLKNYLLAVSILSWTAAQLGKMLLHFVVSGKLSAERLVGSGGMPSSHSALVCALLVGVAKLQGLSSPLFAVCLVLAAVVMYDAMGVRLETGKQAKLLNTLVEDMRDDDKPLAEEEKLKELVGHTPIQVLSGALLGVLVAVLVPVF